MRKLSISAESRCKERRVLYSWLLIRVLYVVLGLYALHMCWLILGRNNRLP